MVMIRSSEPLLSLLKASAPPSKGVSISVVFNVLEEVYMYLRGFCVVA